MKSSIVTLLLAGSLLISLFSSQPAAAMDYILGAKGGYYVWRPFLRDIPGNDFETLESGTGALVGPILGISLTDNITLSLSGLFGEQMAQWNMDNTFNTERNEYQSFTAYLKEQRYDIDTALSYQVIQNFRIFAGYKYQYLKVDWISTRRSSGSATDMNVEDNDFVFKIPLHGAAIGVSYTMPLSNLYFATMTFSGIYTRGVFKYTSTKYKYNTGTSTAQLGVYQTESNDVDIHQIGFNFEPAIGILTGGPIITFGARYQYLRTQFYNTSSSSSGGPSDNWMNDHLYGVFVAVIFML